MLAWPRARRTGEPTGRRAAQAVLITVLLAALPSLGPPAQAVEDPTDLPEERGPDVAAAYAKAGEARLFGRFQSEGSEHRGAHTTVTTDTETGALWGVWHGGRPLLEMLDVGLTDGKVTNHGVVLVMQNDTSAITLHDNRYGWITFRGSPDEVRLRFPQGSELESGPDGISSQSDNRTVQLFYDGPQPNVTMDGATVRLRPRGGELGFTLTLRQGILGREPLAGSWTLLARAGESVVIDQIAPQRLEPTLDHYAGGELRFKLPILDPSVERDAVHRVESVGVFDSPTAGVAIHDGEILFHPANLTLIYSGERAVAWSNVSRSQGNVVEALVRQPLGYSGTVHIVEDDQPPTILDVTMENVTTHWLPAQNPPRFVVRTDERSFATLVFHGGPSGEILIRNETSANVVRLPLDRLEADTQYTWVLTVRDLALNPTRTTGELQTPLDPFQLTPQVEIRSPREGKSFRPGEPVRVVADVHDGTGRPLPPGLVTVTHNERAVRDITWDGTKMTARLGLVEDGRHTVKVIAKGYSNTSTVSRETQFTVAVGTDTPAFSAAATVAALAAAIVLHGRRR